MVLVHDNPVLIKTVGERHTGTRAIITSIRLHPQASNVIPDQEMWTRWNKAFKAVQQSAPDRWSREVNLFNAASCFPNVLKWKHGVPKHDDYDDLWNVHYVLAIRHPYSWVLSFARMPYHRLGKRDWFFSHFIRRQWRCSPRDGLGEMVNNPLDLWQKKNQAYADFARELGARARWLRHEDLIQDGTASLNKIFKPWGIDPELTTLPQISTKDRRDDPETLRERQNANLWKQLLNRADVMFINSQIDWDFARQFDYHPTDPGEFSATLGWRARKLRTYLMLGRNWTDILATP